MAQSLPFWKKLMYAAGQFGWCIASYGVGNLLTYFYMPPESTGEAVFPVYIFQGSIFLGLTIIGVLAFGGRVFDAITDPIIAGLSDRSTSKFGKRRTFLLIGSIPFTLFAILIFIPIVPQQSVVNAVWVAVCIFLFYLFFTMYLTPYYALLSELGHSPKERLQLSTIIAITWALGFMVGSQAYAFQGLFEGFGFSPTNAFQIVILIFGGVGLVTMLLPVIFIDEHTYGDYHVSKEGSFEAVVSALKNRNFLFFTFSDLVYFLALTVIQIGISYYVIVLLQLPKNMASLFMIVLFIVSFAFYVPVNLTAQKLGKKKVIVFGFFLFALGYLFILFMGRIPFMPAIVQGYFIMVWCAVPMAIFGILPNAVVADVAEADGILTGNYKAGVFFGARGFVQKLGISAANLIFPSLLLLGKSVQNDLGIRLSAVVALVFCIAGLVIFLQYDEKHVLETLATKEPLSQEELEEVQDE
ncbi:MAG: MFS transporter [Spirochaetia bacterium]